MKEINSQRLLSEYWVTTGWRLMLPPKKMSLTYDSGLLVGPFVILLFLPVLVVLSVLPLGIISNLTNILVG